MNHLPIDKSKEPQSIRLFRSNFLEFFTHISPVTIIVLWVPVTAFLLINAILTARPGAFPWYIPTAFIFGLFGVDAGGVQPAPLPFSLRGQDTRG